MKKLNKLVAILVAMAMVLAMSVVSAFAAADTDTGVSVAKVLTLPKGVTTPDAEIKFTAELDTIDGITQTGAAREKIEVTLDLTQDLIKTDTSGDAVDVYYFAKQLIAPTKTYSHGGTYVYKLTESSDLKTQNTEKTTNTEIDDSNEYTVNVYVNSTGGISKVTVYDEATKKNVDSTIDTTNIDTQASEGVVFNNALTQIISTDPNDPNASVFKVGKTVVAGANGQADQTTEFAIDVAVTFPTTTGAQAATYKIHKNGVTPDAEVTMTASDVLHLQLAHGEYIYFTSIPAGTKVSATETDARAGATADAGKAYVKSGELATGTISETQINAAIQNATNDTNDTGILMSNLPYIALALVAIGGLVAYVIVRRKADDEA